MPPEQVSAKPEAIGAASDVYSMGAILYHLLTGKPPFQGATTLDTLIMVLESEPQRIRKLNPQVPHELEWMCMRCLEKNPANRYESARELADDLERFLKDEPVAARASDAFHALRRWARRQPALVSRLAALVIVAAVVQLIHLSIGKDRVYHLQIMSILAAWAIGAVVFQRMLHVERLAAMGRFAWVGCEAVLATLLLNFIASSDAHSIELLFIAYPVLIISSGMFFRVRLVLFATALSSVLLLVVVFLQPDEGQQIHYVVLHVAALGILGCLTANQIHRFRVLSRYYEHDEQ